MKILIESTDKFEKDLKKLTEKDKLLVVNKINYYTELFVEHKDAFYNKLIHSPLSFTYLDEYESSLYILKFSQHLKAIITVDEDPIFEQTIFTLFRVVNSDKIDQAFSSIAESIYQELKHNRQEVLKVS